MGGECNQEQEWEHDSRHGDRKLVLPRGRFEARGEPGDDKRGEYDAHEADTADDQDERGCDEVGEPGGLLFIPLVKIFGKDGNERRRERALGKEVARQVGDAEAEGESFVFNAGAEQVRHDGFAQESGDAAGHDGDRRDPGGTGDLFVFRHRLRFGKRRWRISDVRTVQRSGQPF